jgi:hypothetical protein
MGTLPSVKGEHGKKAPTNKANSNICSFIEHINNCDMQKLNTRSHPCGCEEG